MSTKSPVAHASAGTASTRRRVSAKTVAKKKGAHTRNQHAVSPVQAELLAETPVAAAKPVARKKGARATTKETQMTAQEDLLKAAEGNVDPSETETPAPKEVDGLRLFRDIRKKLIDRDLPDRHIADIMGITQIYWSSIMNGHRSIRSLGKDKFKLIADFLEIPVIQAYILADVFSPEDFFNTKSLDEQLWLVIEKMQRDQQWAAYAPTRAEWDAMPVKVRAGYATLYEREYGRSLTEKAKLEVPELANS
jgi:transcriptional regulator with XRE-family HTH domain